MITEQEHWNVYIYTVSQPIWWILGHIAMKKIESALHELYEFASQPEFHTPFHQTLSSNRISGAPCVQRIYSILGGMSCKHCHLISMANTNVHVT
jgi:hypothetical protein